MFPAVSSTYPPIPRLSHATIINHSTRTDTSRRKPMLRKLLFGALASTAMIVSTSAFAQGTAAEAKAMLEKAIAAVKADKAKAIASFNNGTDGFKDRDLLSVLLQRLRWHHSSGPAVSQGDGRENDKGR